MVWPNIPYSSDEFELEDSSSSRAELWRRWWLSHATARSTQARRCPISSYESSLELELYHPEKCQCPKHLLDGLTKHPIYLSDEFELENSSSSRAKLWRRWWLSRATASSTRARRCPISSFESSLELEVYPPEKCQRKTLPNFIIWILFRTRKMSMSETSVRWFDKTYHIIVMSSSWKIPAQAESSYKEDDNCLVPQLEAHGQDVAQFHHLNPL